MKSVTQENELYQPLQEILKFADERELLEEKLSGLSMEAQIEFYEMVKQLMQDEIMVVLSIFVMENRDIKDLQGFQALKVVN